MRLFSTMQNESRARNNLTKTQTQPALTHRDLFKHRLRSLHILADISIAYTFRSQLTVLQKTEITKPVENDMVK